MKKNNGSIFLMTVFVVFFLFICLDFVLTHLKWSSFGTVAKVDSIQSSYCAESIVNGFLAENNLLQQLKLLHQKKTKLILSTNLSMEHMTSPNLNIFPVTNRYGNAVVYASCDYKGIPSGKTLNIQYIHSAYLQKSGIVNSSHLKQGEVEEIRRSLSNTLIENQNKILRLNGNFYLGNVNGQLCFYEENIIDREGEISIEKEIYSNYIPKSLIFFESGSLTMEPNINVDAMIHVNGNLILKNNRIFGVLILNEKGNIEGNGKVEGYVLNIFDKKVALPVKLARQQLDLYMDVLPQFIQVKVISMEKDIS